MMIVVALHATLLFSADPFMLKKRVIISRGFYLNNIIVYLIFNLPKIKPVLISTKNPDNEESILFNNCCIIM